MGSRDEVGSPIVFFDGVCNLCDQSVQFIIRHDHRAHFRFATLQSPLGQQILRKYGRAAEAGESVLLLRHGRLFDRSRAALEICRSLSGLWPLLYFFVIVPPVLRDWIYEWVARNRYRWFGKKEACMIPTPELRSRFIES